MYNPDGIVAINKNSGLSKLLRATLKSNSYLSRFIYRRALRAATIRKEALRLSERCGAKWLAAARIPKKKSSSRLLRKKRGTVGPRERWITKVDFPLRQRNKFVVHPLRSFRYTRRRHPFFPTRFLRRFALRISSGTIIVVKILKKS